DGEVARRSERGVAEPTEHVAVDAHLGSEPGERRIGERHGDRVRGERDPGQTIRPQPLGLIRRVPGERTGGRLRGRNVRRPLDHGHPARRSARRAAASSLRLALSTFGYFRSSPAIVSMIAAATITRVYHLLSAGTTYHGASLVAVARIASSYARMYAFQYGRSRRSLVENFQFFSGRSSRSRKRRFCSLRETC